MTGTGMLASLLISQALFAKTYASPYHDIAYSIVQTLDGGYAVAGETGLGAGYNDFLFLKLASDGSLGWAKTYGGDTAERAWSTIQTGDGGYALVGRSMSFGTGNYNFLVLKISSTGDLEWAKSFGNPGDDEAYSIIQTMDGGYAVAGYWGNWDLMVLKLAPDGSVEWSHIYAGAAMADLECQIIQTSDTGYAVASCTMYYGAGSYEFIVLRMSSDGSLEWAKTYGGTSDDRAYSLVQTADGGLAITGNTSSFGAGSGDVLVLRVAGNGDLQWARTYGGANWDGARSIILTQDGGFAVSGYTNGFGAGSNDFLFLKLSSDGSLEWARTFGDYDNDRAYSNMVQTGDGGFALAGYTNGGVYSFLVLKAGPGGEYPGCVDTCSPTVTSISPTVTSPSVVDSACSPTAETAAVVVNTASLTVQDVCPPAVEENGSPGPRAGITCFPVPSGILFGAREAMAIKIYSADGRVAYSGNLEQGENRVFLKAGVYLWRAGPYKGSVAVR
jgi:uncharacterized protein (DUF2147 family)